MTSKSISVIIVDDHPLFRQGVKLYLESISEINLVGEFEGGEKALSFLKDNSVDVVLMDLEMKGMNGREATAKICESWPNTKVLVISSYGSWDKVYSVLNAGAVGYLLKDNKPEQLVTAIKAVNEGGSYFEREITAQLLNKVQKKELKSKELIEPLTPREIDVLKLIARGLGNLEIAEELCVSKNTVKTHVTNIFQKLEIKSRTQAALYALQEGLI